MAKKAKKKKKPAVNYENEIRLRNVDTDLYDKIVGNAASQRRSPAYEVLFHLEKTYK